MAKKILIGLAAVVGVFALVIGVLAAIAPTELHVEREVVIEKPVAVVFSDLLLVKNHDTWSPWFEKDPNLAKEYKGEDGTVGFVSSWSGNDEVGVGEQEIKKIAENQRIDYELRFEADGGHQHGVSDHRSARREPDEGEMGNAGQDAVPRQCDLHGDEHEGKARHGV